MLGLLEVTSELCAWMVRPLTPQWHAGERLFKSSRLKPRQPDNPRAPLQNSVSIAVKTHPTYEFPTFGSLIGVRAVGERSRCFR
jgi:hypothetical protein